MVNKSIRRAQTYKLNEIIIKSLADYADILSKQYGKKISKAAILSKLIVNTDIKKLQKYFKNDV